MLINDTHLHNKDFYNKHISLLTFEGQLLYLLKIHFKTLYCKCSTVSLTCLEKRNLEDCPKESFFILIFRSKQKIEANDCGAAVRGRVQCGTPRSSAAMRAVNRDAPNKRAFAPTMKLRFPQSPAQLYGRVVIILMFKAKCLSLALSCRNLRSS